ncbi:hypothetical protein F4777DRAFT_466625 [Nemania sp. FL0916]|nr:hypothetical protein F4777DRAFT_466625 [Nemania sp. FL0916]
MNIRIQKQVDRQKRYRMAPMYVLFQDADQMTCFKQPARTSRRQGTPGCLDRRPVAGGFIYCFHQSFWAVYVANSRSAALAQNKGHAECEYFARLIHPFTLITGLEYTVYVLRRTYFVRSSYCENAGFLRLLVVSHRHCRNRSCLWPLLRIPNEARIREGGQFSCWVNGRHCRYLPGRCGPDGGVCASPLHATAGRSAARVVQLGGR